MAALDIYMNGSLIGEFITTPTGANEFSYHESWLNTSGARPISLSMPLRQQKYRGDEVYNFFDNLLPDNRDIRDRIVARHHADSNQPFDLLAKIGNDCVGALQFLAKSIDVYNVRTIDYKPLTEANLEKILSGYKSDAPLGMIREEEDFRISIAGAQEKTALLNIKGQWCLPLNSTPTSHIIKLPIGVIKSHSHTLDMTDSVENEYLCMLIAREFGLPTPTCSIIQAGNIKALAVERFDRKYSQDQSWIMRLPQEDFCQVLNQPSGRKYESQGGPSIPDIMSSLLGSATANDDRHLFMQTQVLFWLLGATDGHAKNFSVFILPFGGYRLTPLYDILSIYPVMGGQGLHASDIKLAMSLRASSSKKYQCQYLFPRHFISTAKAVGFSTQEMQNILNEFAEALPKVIERVKAQLPTDFPQHISKPILAGLKRMGNRLSQAKQ